MKKNEQNSLNEEFKKIHQPQFAQSNTLSRLRKWLGKSWRNVRIFMIDKSDFCYWNSQNSSFNESRSLDEQRDRLEQIYRISAD